MAQKSILDKIPESNRIAFYGALFAIAAADGSIDPKELSLILETADMQSLSSEARQQVQSYIVKPPQLEDCLKELTQANELLRLGLMFFLINVAWVDQLVKPDEEQALKMAQVELRISDQQFHAIEVFIHKIRKIHERGLNDKNAAKEIKEAIAQLKVGGIPLATIDPKNITTNLNSAQTSYSEENFWEKIKNFASSAGKEVIEKALLLYYAAENPKTPVWAKTTIYAALAYFIFPVDAVPDILPVVGFTDDWGTLIAAITVTTMYITPEVKEQAKQKVQDWFKDSAKDVEP
jgi:uncharacterized membrane protein YkvA (DUF1232 family)/uncharacterized tellurite resistance protein B-like protein